MLRHLRDFLKPHIEGLPIFQSGEGPRLNWSAPKSVEQGQICLPVFPFAKALKKAPPLIAKEIAAQFPKLSEVEKVEAVSGFVNFHFSQKFLIEALFQFQSKGLPIGWSSAGAGKKVVVDYASPNVAKPMGIGHLRATVIGQAVCNLARTQGYEVIGLNYLGDWGSQFGKLAWAYQEWSGEYDFDKDPIDALFQIYVRFQAESEKNPDLNALGAKTFKSLEDGDPQITELWKRFIDLSITEYERLFKILGVKHDLVRGESFFNSYLKPTEKKIEEKGLLEESQGAMVVSLEEEGLPPCLIRKSDGASLYATRDIASAIYRVEELGADLNLYVVGVDQNLHFKQVFKVLDKMGYKWAKQSHHIAFGMYRFKDGKMSTRKGRVIFCEDVLNRAFDLVSQLIEEKNPGLQNKEQAVRDVAVGAIIFNDLVNDRVKNVDFDWDRALSFEGDSGPYVQYTNVRCLSLLRKYGSDFEYDFSASFESFEEKELLRRLLNFEDTLEIAFENFKPHILAGYLLDVCRQFSQFYAKNRILGEVPQLERTRMSLVKVTQLVISTGLEALNIPQPEAM